MKKLGLALATATAFCLTVAAPALAKYPPGVKGESGGSAPNAGGAGGTGGAAGTAFTGANVSLWIVVLAVLVVVGITALVVSRRRAAATSG